MAVRIPLITDFDGRGIRKAMAEFKQLEGAAAKTQFALQKAFLPAAAALGALTVAGGKAVSAASDLAEAQSAANKVFGDGAKAIEEFASTAAKNLGQSRRQATQAATTFAAFGKSAGLSGTELVDFSTKFVKLASDMASFKNTSPEEAITAIGAAFRGETEPIRKYNVLLDDASLRQKALQMGIVSTTKNALTPQQKVLAAGALIMEQTVDLQDDFIDTSGGLANSQRQVTASLEDTSAAIGAALLPAVEAVLPVIEKMAEWAAKNPAAFLATGAAIGTLAAGIIAANIAMKAWNALTIVTTGLNKVLGTSFTRLQTAMGAVGLILGAAVTVYTMVKGSKDKLASSTKALTSIIHLEGKAHEEALADLIANDKNVRELIEGVDKLGYSYQDLIKYLRTGTGPISGFAKNIDDLLEKTDFGTDNLDGFVGMLVKTRQEFINVAAAGKLARDAIGATSNAAAYANIDFTKWRKQLGITEEGTGTATKETNKFADALRDRFRSAAQAARDALADLVAKRDQYAASIADAIKSTVNFATIQSTAKEAGQTFMATLAATVAKAKVFAQRLQQLMAAGLSQDALTQVAQAGADAGTAIADELLAGGATAISQANDLVEAAKTAAQQTGSLAGQTYYDEGIVLAQQLTAGITSVISKYKIKLRSAGLTDKQLRRLQNRFAVDVDFLMSQVPALANGGLVTGPQLALIGEAGPEAVIPLDKMGQMGNVTINVNGGDPNAVVDALRTYMRQNGSVPIKVSNLY